MSATIDDVMGWDPCPDYPRERITELFGDRETLTALDVLALDIPADDRLWAVLRKKMVPAAVLHEFACRCAERALARLDSPDPRSIEAIRIKRAWLRGEASDEELAASKSDAYAATYAAYAAYAADATGPRQAAAAYSAAYHASSAYAERAAAAVYAYTANASAAAAAAEHEWQVSELRRMLEGGK